MPILTEYERTYEAPPEPIGSTTGDMDYDESEPYYVDVFQDETYTETP